jgi:hypothetical protein
MSFDSTTYRDSIYTQVPAAYAPPARKRSKAKAKPRRTVNYKSDSTPATLTKQAQIRELLAMAGEGLTVAEIGKALGISRQLALYHCKKMAATYQAAMILEPCMANGGLQFTVWDEVALASHYSRFLLQTVERRPPRGRRVS